MDVPRKPSEPAEWPEAVAGDRTVVLPATDPTNRLSYDNWSKRSMSCGSGKKYCTHWWNRYNQDQDNSHPAPRPVSLALWGT